MGVILFGRIYNAVASWVYIFFLHFTYFMIYGSTMSTNLYLNFVIKSNEFWKKIRILNSDFGIYWFLSRIFFAEVK
jgi:hypothetical protein